MQTSPLGTARTTSLAAEVGGVLQKTITFGKKQKMSDSLKRVAIVGHSFVNRFEDFTVECARHADRRKAENKPTVVPSLGLDCEVHYIGVRGGGVAHQKGTVQYIARRLTMKKFDVVVMMLGDNDVQSCKDDLHGLASRILAVAALFKSRARADAIYITAMFPRYPRADGTSGRYPVEPKYNAWAQSVNQDLKSESAQIPGVAFWQNGFSDPSEYGKRNGYIGSDGVHLTEAGQCRLYKSVRRLLTGHLGRVR